MPKAGVAGSGDRWRYTGGAGAAAFSLPIPVSSARGVAPALAIETSAANGPFGFGLGLTLRRISRRTDLRVPRYDDSDQFSIDANPLTPLAPTARRPASRLEEDHGVTWRVDAYQHRVQTMISIERWSDPASGDVYWKTISQDGDVSYFGRTALSRIADPDAPEKIADWLLDETCDTQGNRVIYHYRVEDSVGVAPGPALDGHDFRAGRHLDRITYGNWGPTDDERFALSVLFDYGDYDPESLAPSPVGPWTARPDCVSSYRRGFEVRDARLCQRVLMVHALPEVNGGDPVTVAAISFDYGSAPGDADAKLTVLCRVRGLTCRMDESGRYAVQLDPVRTLTWSAWSPSEGQFAPLPSRAPPALWSGGLDLIDLAGEGAPGLLTTEGEVIWYRAPLEQGYQAVTPLGRPQAGAVDPVTRRLEDLTGSGRLDVMTLEPGLAGYAPAAADGGWGLFQPFQQTPPGDLAADAISVSMTGSGLPDLALFESERVCLFPSVGRAGFAAAVTAALPTDFPPSDTDPAALIAFADMFGDGLPHRIRIAGGKAQIWPCFGNGLYGPSVTMVGAPDFGDIPSSRVRLADVTGSGLADLLVIREDRIDIYLNQAGVAFAQPFSITPPFPIDSLAQIGFADLSSAGVPSLVLTAFAPVHQTRVFDFCADVRPYQLTGFDNGVGQSLTFGYRSARDYYLRAKSGGGDAPVDPWVTRMAAPPQVVASVDTADAVSGTLRRETFQYRNGHYDAVEKRFVGFSQVDHVDVTDLAPPGWQFPYAKASPAPAVAASLTRTWYDLGAAAEANAVRLDYETHRWNGDPLALELPPSVFAPEIIASDAETRRQAAYALSGQRIRSETFEIDPDGKVADVPLTVSQGNAFVTLIQARTQTADAIFLVTSRESVEAQYEGVADDPRVEHDVTLAWDIQGAVTLETQVAYPRRAAFAEPGLFGQNALAATATLKTYAGEIAAPLGLCWEEKVVELGGLPRPPANTPHFDYDALLTLTGQAIAPDRLAPYGGALPADGRPCSRQLKWNRTAFWNAAQKAPAPPGTAPLPVLVHHHETAVLSDVLVAEIYQNRVSPACLADNGYVAAENYWWAWGDIVVPGPAAVHFAPVSATNAFGKTTLYAYDPYAFLVTSITDPAGNINLAEIDYQALEPWRLTDPNGVVIEALLGPDGRPMVETVWKLDGQGDVIGNAPVSAYRPVAQVSVEAVLAAPETFLQGAGAFTYTESDAPPVGAPRRSVSVRRTAWVKASGAATSGPTEVEVAYFDGAGRLMGKAFRVSGDYTTAAQRPPGVSETDPMWVLSGRRDLDAKEQPLRVYAPTFAAMPDWAPPAPATPFELYQYDGAGRQVLSASPSGWTATIARAAWSQRLCDRNATDPDSPFFGLATVINLDVWGRPIGTTRFYADPRSSDPPRRLTDYVWRDAEGRVTGQVDARFYSPSTASGLRNFTTAYGMTDQPLTERSVDMAQRALGLATTFYDSLGGVVIGWDNKGRRCITEYDLDLRRPVAQHLSDGGVERVIARMAYGVDPATNSIGRQVQVWDQSGQIAVQTFDLLGQPSTFTRRYRTAYDTPIDWTDLGAVPMEPELWSRSIYRGATGATDRGVEADGSTLAFTRNPGGALRSLSATWSDANGVSAEVVTSAAYDSHGQPLRRALANGAFSEWTYDPLEARLVEAAVTRGDERVTAATFLYDRVGNAQSTTSLISPQTEPLTAPKRTYAYDSFYRLVSTTGLEQASMTGARLAQSAAPVSGRLRAARADPSQLAPYTRSFTYDDGDNLTQIRHVASDTPRSWTRDFVVSSTSNHAAPAELVGQGGDPDTFFDATGNMLRLDQPWALQYDEADRLTCAVAVSRQSAGQDASWYQHDMARHRARRVVVQAVAGGQRVEESLYVGNLVVTRVSLVSAAGSKRLSDSQSLTVDDGGGAMLVRTVAAASPPALRYQFGDALGSVTLELDQAAQVITYEEYHAFGETAFAWGRSQTETQTKPYRFTGQQRDRLNGLYFIGARVYSPSLCRWITPDPAGASDGQNIYAYVHNNPASTTDPSGYGKGDGLDPKPLRDGKKKSAKWAKLSNKRLDRTLLGRGAKAGVRYEKMERARGGKPQRSKLHDYPPAAMSLIDKSPVHMDFTMSRLAFPADTTQKTIDNIKLRPDDVRTAGDLIMLAQPSAKLSEHGIDRAHRLANSSMLAITLSVFDKLYRINHLGSGIDPQALKTAAMNFFTAVAGADMAVQAYDALQEAATDFISTHAEAGNAGARVNFVANAVADHPNNLRFGDSALNQLILHGFDANYTAKGDMTPRSEGMKAAGGKLDVFLELGLITAAFQPTKAKLGGAIMSSSLH